jgi:hypothetical protein
MASKVFCLSSSCVLFIGIPSLGIYLHYTTFLFFLHGKNCYTRKKRAASYFLSAPFPFPRLEMLRGKFSTLLIKAQRILFTVKAAICAVARIPGKGAGEAGFAGHPPETAQGGR